MKITDDGFDYPMPKEVEEALTPAFLKALRDEIAREENLSLTDWNHYNNEGTGAWEDALLSACKQTNNPAVYAHYKGLEWDAADGFGAALTLLMAKYKLIPYDMAKILGEYMGEDPEKLQQCDMCGEYFFIWQLANTGDEFVCGKCSSTEE